MATVTLGTTANNSLASLPFKYGYGSGMSAADIAAINNAIKSDNAAQKLVPGAFSANGLLRIPGRGVLQIVPGDYVGVDSAGWPILVSAYSIANAAWTHT
jgi:hypothetical protein